MSANEKQSRTIVGKVISAKMDKTVVVLVEKKIKHQKYEKYITQSSKRYVHDPINRCKIDDIVSIKSMRRLSKLKAWELVEILSKMDKSL